MADPQDQPDGEPDGATTPPAKKPPAKAAKKTPAKAPAKKAPAKKAAAKKAPAKKAPAKKATATSPEPAPEPVQQQAESPSLQQTNGEITAAAKDVAAQAKSTVEDAQNPVAPAVSQPPAAQSPLPLVVALALSLLAILLVRQLRRR
jgi:cobalamin biosynthesis Mg chelatase CobN